MQAGRSASSDNETATHGFLVITADGTVEECDRTFLAMLRTAACRGEITVLQPGTREPIYFLYEASALCPPRPNHAGSASTADRVALRVAPRRVDGAREVEVQIGITDVDRRILDANRAFTSLKDKGCRTIQGCFSGHPLPPEEVTPFLWNEGRNGA
jgi:hypothetical protein